MEVELQEIRDFLARLPPFEQLPDNALNALTQQLRQGYVRRGLAFPPDNASAGLYLLRQGAIEQRDSEGNLLQKLAEGEYMLHRCLDAQPRDTHTLEDSLYLALDCTSLETLQQQYPSFRNHFQEARIHRLQQALRQQQNTKSTSTFQQRISDYSLSPALQVEADTSIQEAARYMSEAGYSYLLITEGERLLGLLTDSDLRRRVVAEQRPLSEPVRSVMSPKPLTLTAEQPAFEAILLMNQKGIQHLPVLEQGKLKGVLTSRDLMQQEARQDILLMTRLRRANGLEELVEVCRTLPELQRQMMDTGANARQLGLVLAQLSDTLTRRLLALAEAEQGPAPVAWAWLGSGSQARQEQNIASDQDSALILADDYERTQHGDYFQRLARTVSDGLQACGFHYCPGESMALNGQWRQSLSQWRETFSSWVEHPEPHAVLYAANFYDLRHIAGDARLLPQLQAHILPLARDNDIFLAHLAAQALQQRPPLGFFRNFVLNGAGEHARELDLKAGGIMPVVSLARVFALAAGSSAQNTVERLEAAAAAQRLSRERVAELVEAYRLINDLRARHQAQQIRSGLMVDYFLEPAALSPLERRHLKEAFTIIKAMQDYMAHHYQTDLFH